MRQQVQEAGIKNPDCLSAKHMLFYTTWNNTFAVNKIETGDGKMCICLSAQCINNKRKEAALPQFRKTQ